MDATVHALFVKPQKHSKPVAVGTVEVLASGLAGDFHAQAARRRQVLLISRSLLSEFDLRPGTLHENIVIEGLNVMNLSSGQALKIGTATFQVTVPCEPCVQVDRIRPGLKAALKDRRGMFAQVASPGCIRIGDSVEPV
jgi:MOSC domain-containing protein YiiM